VYAKICASLNFLFTQSHQQPYNYVVNLHFSKDIKEVNNNIMVGKTKSELISSIETIFLGCPLASSGKVLTIFPSCVLNFEFHDIASLSCLILYSLLSNRYADPILYQIILRNAGECRFLSRVEGNMSRVESRGSRVEGNILKEVNNKNISNIK